MIIGYVHCTPAPNSLRFTRFSCWLSQCPCLLRWSHESHNRDEILHNSKGCGKPTGSNMSRRWCVPGKWIFPWSWLITQRANAGWQNAGFGIKPECWLNKNELRINREGGNGLLWCRDADELVCLTQVIPENVTGKQVLHYKITFVMGSFESCHRADKERQKD